MTLHARASSRAIEISLIVYSANLCHIKSPGILRRSVDPITYVILEVDNSEATRKSTSKTKQSTINALYQDKQTTVVQPNSIITFFVMSYHKNSPDKIIGVTQMKMDDCVQNIPPGMQTANQILNLDEPSTIHGLASRQMLAKFKKEDYAAGHFPTDMTLTIQITQWPSLLQALTGNYGLPQHQENTDLRSTTNNNMASLSVSEDRNRSGSTRSLNSTGSTNVSANPVNTDPSSILREAQRDLPTHYEARRCQNTGKIYYVDHLTRTTGWEKPRPLPQNWERRSENGRVYYVDHNRRVTQWDHPGDAISTSQTNSQATGSSNSSISSTRSGQQQQASQTAYMNRYTNQNSLTNDENQSEQTKPSGKPPQRQVSGREDDSQLDYHKLKEFTVHAKMRNKAQELDSDSINEITDDQELEYDVIDADDIEKILGPLDVGWEEKTHTNGRKYYLNHGAKVSQWEDPRTLGYEIREGIPAGWQKQSLPDGVTYYINHEKQQTTWDPWQKEGIAFKPNQYFKNKKRPFKDKWTSFQSLCHFNTPEGYMKIQIQRQNIFSSAYRHIMDDVLRPETANKKKPREPSDYRKRLFIQFDKEQGLDYGGVSREFFYFLSHEIADPRFGLFEHSQNYSLKINPHSELAVGADHLFYYRFVGRVVGMCLYHKRYLDVGFSLPFYKKLLGKPIRLSDIADVDEDYYNNLRFILQNEIDEMYMGLDFTMNEDNFGEIKTIELKKGGADIEVTDENKEEYWFWEVYF